jgi:hypothetical protein
MNILRQYVRHLINEEFEKNVWKDFTVTDIKNDDKLADQFFELISTAYTSIGGHSNIKTISDLLNGEVQLFTAVDIDSDPDPDALVMTKKKPAGLKSVGIGHDGSTAAKTAAIEKQATRLKTNVYSEMSGAIAHIMLTRYNVLSIDDEDKVRKILDKDITWLGKHPDNKYPGINGWYIRTIGGKKHMKIMLGSPKI